VPPPKLGGLPKLGVPPKAGAEPKPGLPPNAGAAPNPPRGNQQTMIIKIATCTSKEKVKCKIIDGSLY